VLARIALAAALLAAAVPIGASAAAGSAPIVVSETITNNDNLLPWVRYRGPNNLIVTFKNVATQTVRDVIFVVLDEDGIVRGRIDDKGTFSPGVAIKHVFANCYDSFAPLQATLVPIAVTFADGSTWKGPEAYDFAKLSCPGSNAQS
jgi:hypothetical protein